MTTDRITGRLVQSYTYTEAAQPGWAQPGRHRGEGDEPNERDDAPTGGGWQPAAWGQSGVNVLPGEADSHTPNHHGGGSHFGDEGRGASRGVHRLANRDRNRAPGDSPGLLQGAAGAANGGLRAQGSAPWMSPGAFRRRADGKTVERKPGFLLGHRHVPVTEQRRPGLHFNHPAIRGVRQKKIVTGDDPFIRTMGPIQPKRRQGASPYTYDTVDPAPVASPSSVVGGEWAL